MKGKEAEVMKKTEKAEGVIEEEEEDDKGRRQRW